MKKLFVVLVTCGVLAMSGIADAKGGGSSGGGGSHSSGGAGGHSSSSFGGSKGGYSSSSVSRPSQTAAAPARSTTTTTTTSSTSTRYNSPYVGGGGGMMYGGMGMGYGYTNGLLTGMIIANMMHPHNTVMYTGGGSYNNNALLYPDGRVVNQQGYQVGTYANGQFNAVNGGMVAQQVPNDAGAQQVQPVIIQQVGMSATEIVAVVFLSIFAILLFLILIGL